MTEPQCTPDQTADAIEYLRRGFAGFRLDDMTQRQLRRLFLDYTPAEVTEAIGTSIKRCEGRPAPNELAGFLREIRRRKGVADPNASYKQTPGPFIDELGPDVTRPEDVPARVAVIRAAQGRASTDLDNPEEVFL